MLESLVFKPFTEENLDAATEVFVQVFAAEPSAALFYSANKFRPARRVGRARTRSMT